MAHAGKKYKTLYGSMVEESKVIGYCRKHRVHLTEGQLHQKECLKKHCNALKKWDVPFWKRRDRIKEIKQIKKEAGIPSWQKVEIRTDHEGNLLPKVKNKN